MNQECIFDLFNLYIYTYMYEDLSLTPHVYYSGVFEVYETIAVYEEHGTMILVTVEAPG